VIFKSFTDQLTLNRQVMQLKSIVDEPIVWEGIELNTGLSMGSAYYPDDGMEIDTLLTVADERMYWETYKCRHGKSYFGSISCKLGVSARQLIRLALFLHPA